MNQPHTITAEEVQAGLGWHPLASATTADDTMRKRLSVKVGSSVFRVRRYYLAEARQGNFKPWEAVYEGDDLDAAVQAYNRLS